MHIKRNTHSNNNTTKKLSTWEECIIWGLRGTYWEMYREEKEEKEIRKIGRFTSLKHLGEKKATGTKKILPSACPVRHFFFNWCWTSQTTMGCAVCTQLVMESLRQVVDLEPGEQTGKHSFSTVCESVPTFCFLPWIPVLIPFCVDCKLKG